MEDIIDIIVTETTNTIEITSQPTDEIIDVNIIDNREDVTLNVTPTLVEININSLTGNFGILWGEIEGTLSNQTDLNTALGLKADLVGGKVPSSQLPSYVDDVVEVANYASLPATGETGKIYVTIDTNYIYRWTGSVYVEIKDSSAVWGAITGTLSNQTDLQNALNAKLSTSTAASTYVPYTGATGNVNLGLDYSITAALIIKSGGTSTQFLKADGSIDTNTYATTSQLHNAVTIGTANGLSLSTQVLSLGLASGSANGALSSTDWSTFNSKISGSGATGYYARFTSSGVISDGFIQTTSNITYVEGMGLSTGNGLDIEGAYGAGGGGLKIRSYDETTGNAYIDFANTGGRMYLGLNRSTASGLMTNATAYATVLTTGLGTTNLEFGTNATKRLTIDGTTGAVTATSSITASALYVSGMTAGSGAIYHTGSRLTFANYNASGTLHFEVNGGTGALTINADTSASFVNTISATGATLTGALSGTSASFSDTITINKTGASILTLGQGTSSNDYGRINFYGKGTGSGISLMYMPIFNTQSGSGVLVGELEMAHEGSSADNKSYFSLKVHNGTSLINPLYIGANGAATFSSSVGVGGAVDTYQQMTITASTAYTVLGLYNTAAGTSQRNWSLATNDISAGDFTIRQSGAAGGNPFAGGSVVRLMVNSSGNVGIGTTSPADTIGYGRALDIQSSTGAALYLRDSDAPTTQYGFIAYDGNDNGLKINNENSSGFIRFNNAGSERMRITSSGNVGIGTTSPQSVLHAYQSNATAPTSGTTPAGFGLTFGANDGYNGGVWFSADFGGDQGIAGIAGTRTSGYQTDLRFYTNNTNSARAFSERMRIRAGGSVGINTTGSDSVKLQLVGGSTNNLNYAIALADSGNNDLFYVRCDGYINTGNRSVSPYNNSISGRTVIVDNVGGLGYSSSTRESKTNINSLTNVDWLNALNPVTFNYRKKDNNRNYTDEFYDEVSYGFIADEVEKINPDFVFYDEINGQKKLAGVKYENLTAVLVKKIQEQELRIKQLENK